MFIKKGSYDFITGKNSTPTRSSDIKAFRVTLLWSFDNDLYSASEILQNENCIAAFDEECILI